MDKVRYTPHLELRLRMRQIPRYMPRQIYFLADHRYLDVSTGHNIAVKLVRYGRKQVYFMIAYEKTGEEVVIVTIHPISEEQINARLDNKMWTKIA